MPKSDQTTVFLFPPCDLDGSILDLHSNAPLGVETESDLS